MPYARNRHILAISGADRMEFLHGLVTNDVAPSPEALAYSAILTPQGKFITDFFLFQDCHTIYLDAASSDVAELKMRLGMYKLRADVTINDSTLKVYCGTGREPYNAHSDPRHRSLGWRLYGSREGEDGSDWTGLRVAAIIPATAIELTSNSYILEYGFARINGVDFKKGCYVGQEITARMKHKAKLRKGLVQVKVDGQVAIGTPIEANGRQIGNVFSQSEGNGLAHLRFDQATGQLEAGGVSVQYDPTAIRT